MGKGFTVRHHTDRNSCRVVPCMWLPIPTPPNQKVKICPTCQIHHPVKCLHLWVGPNGECMISQDVLATLRKIGPSQGMEPLDGFTLDAVSSEPPTLKVGDGKKFVREVIDNTNRAQHVYNEKQLTKGAITNG